MTAPPVDKVCPLTFKRGYTSKIQQCSRPSETNSQSRDRSYKGGHLSVFRQRRGPPTQLVLKSHSVAFGVRGGKESRRGDEGSEDVRGEGHGVSGD